MSSHISQFCSVRWVDCLSSHISQYCSVRWVDCLSSHTCQYCSVRWVDFLSSHISQYCSVRWVECLSSHISQYCSVRWDSVKRLFYLYLSNLDLLIQMLKYFRIRFRFRRKYSHFQPSCMSFPLVAFKWIIGKVYM